MRRPESLGDANRHLLLRLIRARQPVSRADLARETGLQRSTVSLITEQLIRQRWVTEGATGQAPRGRKPRLLYLNVERARILGVDVRPAITTIAIADPNGRIVAYDTLPTPAQPQRFVRDLCRRLQAFLRAHPRLTCEGLGITVPGGVDHARERLVHAPNLGWRNIDLKAPIERATGIPVELENAANACALAEASFGAHRDVRDLIVVTVSEGIGTGIISNGRLVRGASGLAGEFGHVCMDPRGPLCSCGRLGCWETFASNNAALAAFAQASGRGAGRPAARPAAPTFDDLLMLADQGDRTATRALTRMGTHLGQGIGMLATALAPRVVLVAGEVTRAWHLIAPAIEAGAETRATGSLPSIMPAGDGAEARLRGTVALVLRRQFGTVLVA